MWMYRYCIQTFTSTHTMVALNRENLPKLGLAGYQSSC